MRYFVVPLFGFLLGWGVWDFILLPYNNPYEIVGPLTKVALSPANNWIRYVVFVTLPAIIYFVLYLAWFRLKTKEKNIIEKCEVSSKIALLTFVAITGVVIVRFLSFFNLPFDITWLDFFHEGEQLTPAINYLHTGGLWTKSLIIHGALYDPFTALLSWRIFNVESIGALRVFTEFLFALIPLGFLFLLGSIYYLVRKSGCNKLDALSLVLILLLIQSNFERHQYFCRRDLFVLLGFGFLLFSLPKRNYLLLFIAGVFSPLCFFYSIDRGAYYSAICFMAIAINFVVSDKKVRDFVFSWFWPLGLLIGFLGFYYLVGAEEFKAFYSNTTWMMKVKDLLDSYPYPKPGFNISARKTFPLIFIGLGLYIFTIYFLNKYYKEKNRLLAALHGLLAIGAFFYYRSAVGRSDIAHLRYVSSFVFLVIGFSIWIIISSTTTNKIKSYFFYALLSLITFIFAFDTIKNIYLFIKNPSPITRIHEFINVPDRDFMNSYQMNVYDRFQQIFKDEKCFIDFSNENSWGYLLKKPSCSRFIAGWSTSPKPCQEEMVRDLETTRPTYILYTSPFHVNTIDGISNFERLKLVYEYLDKNYELYENIEGWIVYKRKLL